VVGWVPWACDESLMGRIILALVHYYQRKNGATT
jgi:hypothetical protein